jgi:hypothetical protein
MASRILEERLEECQQENYRAPANSHQCNLNHATVFSTVAAKAQSIAASLF